MSAADAGSRTITNGAALAAFLSAGIGAFALGLVIVLNETGVFVAPSLYEPAGGVTGRTTIAAVVWLIAWAILHNRWQDRELDASRIHVVTLLLTAIGIVLCMPPVWSLL